MIDAATRAELASRWESLAATATDEQEKKRMAKCASRARRGAPPLDGRASEQEVVWLHEIVGPQTQVRHRVPGDVDPKGGVTTIPDVQVGAWSIETKRYMLRRPNGKAELIAELRRQYAIRLGSLPAHAQLQAIIVDIRGQGWNPPEVAELRSEIYQRVVVACYQEAKAEGKWWAPRGGPPGPETVTAIVGDIG